MIILVWFSVKNKNSCQGAASDDIIILKVTMIAGFLFIKHIYLYKEYYKFKFQWTPSISFSF